tara:strand:+ start:837 stop:1088 length:252 start_codon:yes stop_codon:yes gene_type:complete
MFKFIIFLVISCSIFSGFFFLFEFKEIYINKAITSSIVALPMSLIIFSFIHAIIDTFFPRKTLNDLIKENNKKNKKKNFKVIK